MAVITQRSFLSNSLQRQHKRAADTLRAAFETNNLTLYRQMEEWLLLPPIESTFEEISNRFHYHLKEAGRSVKEHNLLIRHCDAPSNTPFKNNTVYLENLRSAHNVGSIFRTTEAFRFGSVALSPETPTPENKKVRDSAMGTTEIVPFKTTTLDQLPRPYIVLETAGNSLPLNKYCPQGPATYILGNEEYGVTKETLEMSDLILEIPLCGKKNSLNVANAFAILSSHLTYHTSE